MMPMLRQLGVDINFVKNPVSVGIEQDVVRLATKESLLDYHIFLAKHFPESKDDIQKIIEEIQRVMGYMEVLYGIDNPLFLDFKKDKEYLCKTILPWMLKYIFTINKIQRLHTPIDEYLCGLTSNQELIDMIAQHFFRKTPHFMR